MNIYLVLVSILMLLYGVSLIVFSNFTFGTVFTLAIGIGLCIAGVYYDWIKNNTKTGYLKYLKIIICIFVVAEIIFLSFLYCHGRFDTTDYTEDVVIVLGTGLRGDVVSYSLKNRLDKAVEYHKQNPDALIVVSGGQGVQETVTEGYAMEKYLISKGIDKDKIIKEEKSTSTSENMRFSKVILDKIIDKQYSINVITNDFHTFRSVWIAHREGFDNVNYLSCKTPIYDVLPSYLRETLAIFKVLLIG